MDAQDAARHVGVPDYVAVQIEDAREFLRRPCRRAAEVDRAIVWLADAYIASASNYTALARVLDDAATHFSAAGFPGGYDEDAFRDWCSRRLTELSTTSSTPGGQHAE